MIVTKGEKVDDIVHSLSEKLIRTKVDLTIEKKIATASIISTKFLKEIKLVFDPEYLRNSYVKTICFWCLQYYEEYEKSPGIHIQDIFHLEKEQLQKENADIIEAFLNHLSERYEEDQGINEDYVLDSAIAYFKKRELEIRASNITKLLEKNRVDEAEDQIMKYKKVAKLTSGWSDPFDIKSITKVFDEKEEGVFRFPGQLGDMLGSWKRNWVVCILGSFKRGKTFTMVDIAVLSLLSKNKVVFISLEMQEEDVNERIYKRIVASGNSEELIYPVFDCLYNQTGDCTDKKRKNKVPLIGEEGTKPEFHKDLKYRPCSVCRGQENYSLETWFEILKRPLFSQKNVIKSLNSFAKMYGKNLKVKVYPKFSANISDIKRDLDVLEQTEDFIPDIIIVDYAGILKPEDKGSKKIDAIDDTWKTLGQLAGERHCLVITAWQGNRGAIYKKSMDQESVSEWIGIIGHVDIMLTLNQTKEEKRNKQMRIGLIAHRHKDFYEEENCLILQQIEAGQTDLDSERTFDSL
jgi:hypothetical protein